MQKQAPSGPTEGAVEEDKGDILTYQYYHQNLLPGRLLCLNPAGLSQQSPRRCLSSGENPAYIMHARYSLST